MANLYKRYVKVLEKWPLDPSKKVDLGQHLRDRLKVLFPKGENSTIADPSDLLKQIESLEKIADNYYGKKYPLKTQTTATGLTPEQCQAINSTEFQEFLKENRVGYFARFKKKLKGVFYKNTDPPSQ